MEINDLISSEMVVANLKATSKKQVLQDLSRRASDAILSDEGCTCLGRWAGPLGRRAIGPLGHWASGPLGNWARGPGGQWASTVPSPPAAMHTVGNEPKEGFVLREAEDADDARQLLGVHQ